MIRQFLIGVLLFAGLLLAQSTGQIRGQVTDDRHQPLVGVSVYIPHTPYGSMTDAEGLFILKNIPPGTYTVVVELLGYRPDSVQVTVRAGQTVTIGPIRLQEQPLQTNPVVVTATRHEAHLSDVPVSAAVISSRLIRQRTNIFLNQALQYIPGITLNGGQLNIRGSTGYTRGLGSRVLLLVDGMPLLTGDTREINYDVIPTYLIDQVEVVKGAGSALYGSGAMGGVINVQTRPVHELPAIWLQQYGGFYARPKYREWQWSSDRQWIDGQLAGVRMGGERLAAALIVARDEDQGYRQNDWRQRWTVTTKITAKPAEHHEITLLANAMRQQRANFLFWKNLKYALQPPADQLGDAVQSRRGFAIARYRYFISPQKILALRGSWFANHFEDNINPQTGGNRSTANEGRLEAQFTWHTGRHLLITGLSGNYGTVSSNIFGDRSANEGSAFVQDEWRLTSRLTLTGGIRGDVFALDTIAPQGRISVRGAALFKLNTAHRLRVSGGTGFRAPSLAEIFTTTSASGLTVVPNPGLQPETNWGGEVGYRYHGSFWFTDVAVFYSRYNNLIEPTFRSNLQIRFENIQQARMAGGELLINATFWHHRLATQLGYTYVDARDVNSGAYLNFRPRHTLYAQLRGMLPLALATLDYRYISRYDRIDERLALFVRDVDKYNAAHVVDFSLSTRLPLWGGSLGLNFTVKNMLNYYYTDLVGSLAPLRQYVVTLMWEK